MKIIILVLTYLDNDIYSKFYNKQNETWNSINYPGVDTYFIINNGSKKEIDGHFIINDISESLDNLGYKIINGLNKTLNWDYDYIFHTNSSSYIDKELLYKWLENKPRENFYSGLIGYHNGNAFASGCGFAISKDIAKIILANQSEWMHTTEYSDATLGIMLSKLGYSIHPAPRFDITHIGNYEIPSNYFHYRCKTDDRNWDLQTFDRIFKIKK